MPLFSWDRFHQLQFRDPSGDLHAPVHLVKAFPLSAPESDWSVLSATGEELCWVEDPNTLCAEDQALLDAYFKEREFCPLIHRIERVESFSTPSRWHVLTSVGSTTLVLQGEEDIRRLPDRALLITDRSGTQYRIPDRFKLDRQSRKILDRFL